MMTDQIFRRSLGDNVAEHGFLVTLIGLIHATLDGSK